MFINYFDFYQIPVAFFPDETELRNFFFKINREYHPDYFTQSDALTQEKALELTSINNKAYQTLSNPELRIKHILQIFGLFDEDEKYQLPQSFLLEMMDINEQIMEVSFSEDPEQELIRLNQQIANLEENMKNEISPVLHNFDQNPQQVELLQTVKDFYYKNRYILRIKESLSNFAHR